MRLSTSLLAALLLGAPSALAGDPRSLTFDIETGPVIGGQNLKLVMRSTVANAPGLLFASPGGTPTVIGPAASPWPVFSLQLAGSVMFNIFTGPTGTVFVDVPTVLGQFGPVASGNVFFFQGVIVDGFGRRVPSNREAVEVEPTPPFPGFFTEVGGSQLPGPVNTIEGYSVASADFDRDGIPDLVVTGFDTNSGNEFLGLWRNDGSGQFVDETALRIPGFSTSEPIGGVVVADFNGDNKSDLLVSGGDDSLQNISDRLFLDDGTGFFFEDNSFDGGALLTLSMTPGDFDNDGLTDLVRVVGEASHSVGVLAPDQLVRNTGTGWINDSAFENASWNNPFISTTRYASGDLDNDGDLDLFSAALTATNRVLANDGSGAFTDVSALALPGVKVDNSLDAFMADLNLDGWLDVVVANSHFSFSAANSGDLYLNDGTGVLVERNTGDFEISPPSDGFRITVDVADLDSDGDPDIFVGGHDLFLGAVHQIYLNNGGAQGGTLGEFTRQFWFDPVDCITSDVEIVDIDTDGDLDVLHLSAGVVSGDPLQGFVVRLFRNDNL